MSGVNIDYNIIKQKSNRQKIIEGDLQNIKEKKNQGVVIGIKDVYTFEIKLKHKANVMFIQYKPFQTRLVSFELLGEKDSSLELIVKTTEKGNDADLVQFPLSKKNKFQTYKIRVTLSNPHQLNSDCVGLKYLFVKVAEDNFQKKGKVGMASLENKKKKEGEKQYFDQKLSPYSAIPKVNREVAIFSERKKNKDKVDDKSIEEDTQLQKAIELSKKQAMKGNKKEEPMQIQDYSINIKSKVIEHQHPKPRQYNTIDYQKCKNVFNYVSQNWLQAQKKAQQQKGIRQSERLSSKIQVKHLYNKNICVDLPANKKSKIQEIAKYMGGKIIQQISDNCILISDLSTTEKVHRSRKLKNVKVLRSNYIQDCKSLSACLEERDYFLKL